MSQVDHASPQAVVQESVLSSRLVAGTDVLDRLGPGLDDLLDATAAPVTARRPWLSTWIHCHPGYRPFAVIVANGREQIEAAALLARRRKLGIDEFVALGSGPSDFARLPARTHEAAAVLSAAVVEHLAANPRPWRLTFRHLPRGDAVATQIAAALDGAELVDGDGSPSSRFGDDRSPQLYMSHSHLREIRRISSRMSREGLAPVVEHLRDEAAVRAALPQVEEVCRQRDLSLRGRSTLEVRDGRRFFQQVILEHAARGEVELTTVRIGASLAAYTLCFLDHGVRRMWSCKLSPDWTRYSAGRVSNDAAFQRALADRSCMAFDWMRGEEPYKFAMSNHLERAQDLLAWSSPALKAILHVRWRVRDRLKRLTAVHGELRTALLATRRFQAGSRRLWRALLGTLQQRRS